MSNEDTTLEKEIEKLSEVAEKSLVVCSLTPLVDKLLEVQETLNKRRADVVRLAKRCANNDGEIQGLRASYDSVRADCSLKKGEIRKLKKKAKEKGQEIAELKGRIDRAVEELVKANESSCSQPTDFLAVIDNALEALSR